MARPMAALMGPRDADGRPRAAERLIARHARRPSVAFSRGADAGTRRTAKARG